MVMSDITTRRAFFSTAGAALAAPLALDAVEARPSSGTETAVLDRLARLEDLQAVAAVTAAFARRLHAGEPEAVAAVSAATPNRAPLEALRRLSLEAPATVEPIVLGADGSTAAASIPCTAELETPLPPECTLVEMARAQGGGIVRRLAHGAVELLYEKRAGAWRVASAVFVPSTIDAA